MRDASADTDTLTYLHAGHARVVERLRAVEDPDVGTTIVTKIELLRGRFDHVLKAATAAECLRAQERLLRTEELLAQILFVPLNQAAVAHVDRLRALPGLRRIGRADLLIAAIALAHKATLVTRNVGHFRRVPGLTVVN
ncbi:MAG: type II toxin-antitoxin system VapC family toxin [Deltaproteobacteria bacterium]|nr:type II toxin-antitoxin system VapC family toxin [Deltaproteobacteria bacterium]